ncbi:hypothetical protein EVG20_g11535 [Dentipellis fragilis]|uniref:Uncharacterized protein n=1 Tax=Dentipellis fragilis TaxID=205917 RepID=A0A4Y9XM30_9AGAM|nr:hypothetical protein EVG20_g11535 [Dentipellis fragilis]
MGVDKASGPDATGRDEGGGWLSVRVQIVRGVADAYTTTVLSTPIIRVTHGMPSPSLRTEQHSELKYAGMLYVPITNVPTCANMLTGKIPGPNIPSLKAQLTVNSNFVTVARARPRTPRIVTVEPERQRRSPTRNSHHSGFWVLQIPAHPWPGPRQTLRDSGLDLAACHLAGIHIQSPSSSSCVPSFVGTRFCVGRTPAILAVEERRSKAAVASKTPAFGTHRASRMLMTYVYAGSYSAG